MTVTWLWLGVSIIGALVSGWLSRESLLDLQALPLTTNGRRIIAWSRLTREVLRVTVHVAYILAALAALGIIPWLLSLIVWFLMYGNIVLVINSIIDARTRRFLVATRSANKDAL